MKDFLISINVLGNTWYHIDLDVSNFEYLFWFFQLRLPEENKQNKLMSYQGHQNAIFKNRIHKSYMSEQSHRKITNTTFDHANQGRHGY